MGVLGVLQAAERGKRTRPSALCWTLSSALLLLALTCSSGVAQTPGQRIALAHFRDSIGASVDSTWLHRAHDRAGAEAERDPDARLRLGAIERRLGEFHGQRSSLEQAIREFATIAREHPDWPEAWYGIALTKLALYEGGYTVKAGPFQRTGTSYLHGAADAFIRALGADPGYVAAAERLTTTVLRETFQPESKEALPPLRRAVTAAPGAPADQVEAFRFTPSDISRPNANRRIHLSASVVNRLRMFEPPESHWAPLRRPLKEVAGGTMPLPSRPRGTPSGTSERKAEDAGGRALPCRRPRAPGRS